MQKTLKQSSRECYNYGPYTPAHHSNAYMLTLNSSIHRIWLPTTCLSVCVCVCLCSNRRVVFSTRNLTIFQLFHCRCCFSCLLLILSPTKIKSSKLRVWEFILDMATECNNHELNINSLMHCEWICGVCVWFDNRNMYIPDQRVKMHINRTAHNTQHTQ